MRKSLIVAMTPSGIIGKDNGLPWPRLQGDLPRFRRLTMGKPCIMGRKTFESLPKPLDGRLNIVVSRSGFESPSATTVPGVLEGWAKAGGSGCNEAFVIGGSEVYRQALPSCDRLYLTVLSEEFDGDTRFDLPNLKDWTIVERERIDGPIPYQNIILDRGEPPVASSFLTLERLDKNTLPTPGYATPHSAGLDFAACLTRPCMSVEAATGNKEKFWVVPNNSGSAWVRRESEPHLDPATVDNLALLLYPGETVLVPLGWKCAFHNSCVFNMYVRSSVGLKGVVLANGTGIIDPDYRGELFAALTNRTDKRIVVKHGERIVQGILTHFSQGIILEGKVDETVRGEGGLGSTGQMAIKQEQAPLPKPSPERVRTVDGTNGPDDVYYG